MNMKSIPDRWSDRGSGSCLLRRRRRRAAWTCVTCLLKFLVMRIEFAGCCYGSMFATGDIGDIGQPRGVAQREEGNLSASEFAQVARVIFSDALRVHSCSGGVAFGRHRPRRRKAAERVGDRAVPLRGVDTHESSNPRWSPDPSQGLSTACSGNSDSFSVA